MPLLRFLAEPMLCATDVPMWSIEMHEWINTALSVAAVLVSIILPLRLFRISTYPVPQIALRVRNRMEGGVPQTLAFIVDIGHVGEKTTIVRPELYMYARDPGKFDEPSPKRHWWSREEWVCFYKRILPDISAGQGHPEELPLAMRDAPAADRFLAFLLASFPHLFRFIPTSSAAANAEPLVYSYRPITGGKASIPVLIRVEYQLGLQSRPWQVTEHESIVTFFIDLPTAGLPDALRYAIVSAPPHRFARLRHLRRSFRGKDGITADQVW
jgi:hypothetical protein